MNEIAISSYIQVLVKCMDRNSDLKANNDKIEYIRLQKGIFDIEKKNHFFSMSVLYIKTIILRMLGAVI